MGKAIITSNEGEGLYLVDYIYNTAALDARIAQLNLRIIEIESVEIPAMEAAITDQEATIAATISDINAAIVAENEEAIITLTVRRNKESAVIASLESQLAAKKGEALSVNQQIIDLNAKRKASENVSAWCADDNPDLAIGLEVGVMEFPGEAPGVSQPVIIRPGGINGDENAFVDSDGIMTQSIAMSPVQLYYMQGIFPAWQRWQPLYRLAVISLIDTEADTCTVHFDNNKSSYQGLDTIPEGDTVVAAVPIEYGICNASVFESGDRVVVECTTLSVGYSYIYKVIGFESSPKTCGHLRFRIFSRDGETEILNTELTTKEEVQFRVFDSNGSPVTFTYEYVEGGEENYWDIKVVGIDPDGYFIEYYDVRGVEIFDPQSPEDIPTWTQYPGICEEEEKKSDPEHLYKFQEGVTEVNMLFLRWTSIDTELLDNPDDCNGFFWYHGYGSDCYKPAAKPEDVIRYQLLYRCFVPLAGECDTLETPPGIDCDLSECPGGCQVDPEDPEGPCIPFTGAQALNRLVRIITEERACL